MNKIKRTGSVFFLIYIVFNIPIDENSVRMQKKHQSQNCGKSDWKYEVYVFNVFSGMLL